MASNSSDRRNAIAKHQGFKNDYERRLFIKKHHYDISLGKAFVKTPTANGGTTYNPRQALAHERAYPSEYWNGEDFEWKDNDIGGEELGSMRHFALAYLMDYDGYNYDEAYEIMQEIFGDSGKDQ